MRPLRLGEEKKIDRKIEIRGQKFNGPLLHRAAIINWPLRQTIGSLTELRMDDHQSFFNFLRMRAEMFDELLRRVGPRCHETHTSCLTIHRPHASVASSPDLFYFRRPSRACCATWCTTFSVPRQTCLLPSLFSLTAYLFLHCLCMVEVSC